MPAQVHKRSLTIALYRLVAMDDGATKVMPDQKWQPELAKVALGDFELESGTTATLQSVKGKRRLIFSRDRGYSPRQRNTKDGRKSSTVVTGSDWQVVEETFVTFLEYGNVFAFARSGIAAPQPPVVAEWLEQANVLGGERWMVLPLIDEERFRLVQEHPRATWLLVKGYPTPAIRVPASAPILSQFFGMDATPGVELQMRIQAKERRLASTVPNSIGEETRGLMAILGQTSDAGSESEESDEIERSQRTVIPRAADADGRGTVGRAVTSAIVKLQGEPEPVDLIEHHLTLKAQAAIKLKPKDRSLNETDVFTVMDKELQAHQRAICKALGR